MCCPALDTRQYTIQYLSVSVPSLSFTAILLHIQGYKSGDVTILTPYVGQLQKIRRELERYMTVVLNERDLDMIPEDEVLTAHKATPYQDHYDKLDASQIGTIFVSIKSCQ